MATLPIEQDEEEQRRLQEGQPLEITAGGQGQAPPTGSQTASQQSPGFVDTAAYLQANKESAQDTARKVSADLAEKAMGLRGKADELGNIYGGEIEGASYKPNTELIDRAAGAPETFVQNPDDVREFQGYWNARYQGPTSFQDRQDFQGLKSEIDDRTRAAEGVDTESGRTALLSGLNQRSTRGMNALDQLLIGANPEARGILKEGASEYKTLGDYLEGVRSDSVAKALQAKEQADSLRTGTRDRFVGEGGVVPTFGTDLESRVAAARQAAQQKTDTLRGYVQNRTALTPEQASALGMSPEQYNAFLGDLGNLEKDWGDTVDFNPYFKDRTAEEAIRAATLANPQDYARESALETLIGQELPYLFSADQGQAGTAPDILTQFDIGGAGEAAKGKLSARDLQFIEAFGGNTPGVPGYLPKWPIAAPYYDESDPLAFYKRASNVYGRNPDNITPEGKSWLDTYSPYLKDGGGVSIPDMTRPPTAEEGRTATDVDGNFKWWDGSAWVDAPTEFRDNPETGQREKFNYDTGQYEPTSDDGGIFRAF